MVLILFAANGSVATVLYQRRHQISESLTSFVIDTTCQFRLELDFCVIYVPQHVVHECIVFPCDDSDLVAVFTILDTQPSAQLGFREAKHTAIFGDLRHCSRIGVENFSAAVLGFMAERVKQLVDSKQIRAVADVNDDVPYGFGQEVRQPQCCDGITIQALHFPFPPSSNVKI